LSSRTPVQTRAELALAFLTFVWGSTFVAVKSALDDSSTLLFLAIRFSMAAAVLIVAFRGGEWKGRNLRHELGAGLLVGVLLFSGYLFQTWGLLYTTPAKSGFLTGMNIAFVPLLGALLYRRTPAVSEWLGIAIAAGGMGLLTLEGQKQFSVNRGDLLTLFCAFAFALHLLAISKLSPIVSYRNLSMLQVGCAAVLALGSFWWAEPVRFQLTSRLGIALLVTSLFGTALAFTLMTWAQRHTTPTRAAVLFSLEPVVALGTSYIVSGEVFSRQAILGAVLILAGILLVELKPIRVS